MSPTGASPHKLGHWLWLTKAAAGCSDGMTGICISSALTGTCLPVKAGDIVVRRRGEGDTKIGRIIAPVPNEPRHWLVIANGHIFRDHERDLHMMQRVW